MVLSSIRVPVKTCEAGNSAKYIEGIKTLDKYEFVFMHIQMLVNSKIILNRYCLKTWVLSRYVVG